jgi:hypothetical protein
MLMSVVCNDWSPVMLKRASEGMHAFRRNGNVPFDDALRQTEPTLTKYEGAASFRPFETASHFFI